MPLISFNPLQKGRGSQFGCIFVIFFFILSLIYPSLLVGSGTAGSLIAQRIDKETNYTFIVLEAGARSHSFHDIPVFGPLLHNSIFDWQYKTVPQINACHAMEGSVSI